jgi:hypothetical protein
MPLHLPDPPTGVADTVTSTVKQFAGSDHHSLKALRAAKPDSVTLTTPHQVFTMGLDDLTAGAGLDKARPVGWRHLVQEGGKTIASSETTLAQDGTTHVPSHLNEGPFVAATDAAVAAAQALPQVASGDYELRLLRIPPAYFMGLWLHSTATDLLVPLAPSPIGQEGQAVPAADVLRELAQRASASGVPPGPPGPGGRVP